MATYKYMPLLIQIKLLIALKFATESTAACTVVKLQQPLWSTQRIEVVLESIVGKLGEKLSQIEWFVFLSSWWWWPRWTSLKVKWSSTMKEVDIKIAIMAMKRGKYMPLGFIFFWLELNEIRWERYNLNWISWVYITWKKNNIEGKGKKGN